jgi:hypothetical protein
MLDNVQKHNNCRHKLLALLYINNVDLVSGCPRRKLSILRGHCIGHSKQKLYMYVCHILNGFRERAISLFVHCCKMH